MVSQFDGLVVVPLPYATYIFRMLIHVMNTHTDHTVMIINMNDIAFMNDSL